MKPKKRGWTKALLGIVIALIAIAMIGVWWMHKTEKLRFVKQLGAGINIGNSLDSTGLAQYHPDASVYDYETYWGNVETTEELFIMIKEGGFSTVRLPVTWEEHLDEEGRISKDWMKRVKEVVDMALNQELYVILDTHHEDWMSLELAREEEITQQYESLWRQIAEQFQDYDEKLLFEGMNEPRLQNSNEEWTTGTSEMRQMVNRLNRVFVDTVRACGENNASRYLLIGAYCNRYEAEALKDVEIPEGNVLVSVHMYFPYVFCQKRDGITEWDDRDKEIQQYQESLEENFQVLQDTFIKKGIPVVITEFGCIDKDNLESRLQWLRVYKEYAAEMGISCIWWDNGRDYQIMDRKECTWTQPEIKELLVK